MIIRTRIAKCCLCGIQHMAVSWLNWRSIGFCSAECHTQKVEAMEKAPAMSSYFYSLNMIKALKIKEATQAPMAPYFYSIGMLTEGITE